MVEPFFKVIVELGYDRSIRPWEPTPARLIPPLHPVAVATDLVSAIGEGINNAFALFGWPSPLRSPVPALAAPATETAKADIFPQVMSIATPIQTEQVTPTGAATGTRQMSMDMAPSTTKVTETANADVSRQVTPAETVTKTGDETSSKKSIETATANEAPAGPTAASAPETSASASTPEPSADASTPKPAKPAGQPAKPRPVVRGSLGWAGSCTIGRTAATPTDRPPGRRAGDGSGDGRILLGRIIVSGFVVDRPQLVGHRLI